MAAFTVTTSCTDVAPLETVLERTCIARTIPVLLDQIDAIVEAEDCLGAMAYGDPGFLPLQIAINAERIAAAALAQRIIELRAQHPSDGLLIGFA